MNFPGPEAAKPQHENIISCINIALRLRFAKEYLDSLYNKMSPKRCAESELTNLFEVTAATGASSSYEIFFPPALLD